MYIINFGYITETVFFFRHDLRTPAFLTYIYVIIIVFLPTVIFSINFFANSREKRLNRIIVSAIITVLILFAGLGNDGGFVGAAIMYKALGPLALGCFFSLLLGALFSKELCDNNDKPKLWHSIMCIILSFVLWVLFLEFVVNSL